MPKAVITLPDGSTKTLDFGAHTPSPQDVDDAIEVMKARGMWPSEPAAQPAAQQPTVPAAQPAALYPTMESAIAADVAREAEQAPSTLVGGAVQGVSQVGRGLFEAPFVAAEALGVPTGQLGEEAEKFAQSGREEEAKAFRPSVSLEEAEGLEYGTWVAESLARMVPGMAAAMASMPAYAVSLVADTARERARADGRDEVNVGDLAAAAASSGFIAASERLGAKVALGGKLPKVAQRMTQTAPGRIAAAAGTEAATEVAQEAVQYGAERLGTEAGARWEELGPRLKEAAVLAPIVGGGIRGATETARAVRDRPAAVPEVEMQEVDAVEVGPQEADAPKDATPESVNIESVYDEEGEVDEDTANALDKIAKDRNLGITRDRDPFSVVRDAQGNVIGGAYTSFDGDNYTFDVVVSEDHEGKGVASKLLDDAIQNVDQYQDANPDTTMKIDVINPKMREMLERRGFKVSETVGNDGRVVMEPSDYDLSLIHI